MRFTKSDHAKRHMKTHFKIQGALGNALPPNRLIDISAPSLTEPSRLSLAESSTEMERVVEGPPDILHLEDVDHAEDPEFNYVDPSNPTVSTNK